MYPHNRAHYRIRYPDTARPVFVQGDGKAPQPVVDCSETGFRFMPPATEEQELEIGSTAHGEIRFRSGQTTRVAGVVVRIQESEVAVHLTIESIPFGIVVQEQLFLRRRFPFYYAENKD